jgi:hypothetical protein
LQKVSRQSVHSLHIALDQKLMLVGHQSMPKTPGSFFLSAAILEKVPQDVKIIPGHGPLAGIEDLRSFRDMLSDSSEIVSNRMREGKSLEQIKSAGLLERFALWTKGFLTSEQWLELVYNSPAQSGKK